MNDHTSTIESDGAAGLSPAPEQTQALPDSAPVPSEMDLLLTYLQDHDATCPLCRYNLRGLTRPVCPECGKSLRLNVGLTEAYLAPWITATASMCLAAGLGLFFLIMVIVEGMPGGSGPPVFLNFVIVAFIATVPVAVLMIVLRRRYLRLPRGTQWGLAVTMLGYSVVSFASLIGVVIAGP